MEDVEYEMIFFPRRAQISASVWPHLSTLGMARGAFLLPVSVLQSLPEEDSFECVQLGWSVN